MQILRQEGHQRPREVVVRQEGAPPRKRGKQKRIKTILEKWPPGPKEGTRVLEGRAGAPRKTKGHNTQQGIQDIRQWFEKGGKPSQVAPENKEGCGSMEPQK